MLDGTDGTIADELPQPRPSGVVTELEVEERDDTGTARGRVHRLRVGRVAAEWLVAQHGLARLHCANDEVAVAERGSVHRDEVDVVAGVERADCGVVAR